MSQRRSEYERKADDAYWTPKWVFDALYSVEAFKEPYDCAPRNAEYDFLTQEWIQPPREIVTNPPFGKADAFVNHSIMMAKKVAMLLPMTFDAAKSRRHLFECRPFKAKYTILDRIRWENLEQKKNGPSTNHAWYVWDWEYDGAPYMGWLTKPEVR